MISYGEEEEVLERGGEEVLGRGRGGGIGERGGGGLYFTAKHPLVGSLTGMQQRLMWTLSVRQSEPLADVLSRWSQPLSAA